MKARGEAPAGVWGREVNPPGYPIRRLLSSLALLAPMRACGDEAERSGMTGQVREIDLNVFGRVVIAVLHFW